MVATGVGVGQTEWVAVDVVVEVWVAVNVVVDGTMLVEVDVCVQWRI